MKREYIATGPDTRFPESYQAVLWEWLNALSGAGTRGVAAEGYHRAHADALEWRELTEALTTNGHFEQAGLKVTMLDQPAL